MRDMAIRYTRVSYFILAMTAMYVACIVLLALFQGQISSFIAAYTKFSEYQVREDFGQFYYYLSVAFVLTGSLLLVALRRHQAADPAAPRSPSAVKRARLVIFGVTAVFVPVVGIAYVARQPLGLDALFVEDGPSEWFTALVFFAAAAVLGVRALRAFRARDVGWRLTAPLCAGVAILAAFIALEEISYGQRLFGVATPDWLADANDQHEINLHNLVLRRLKWIGRGLPGVRR